MAASNADAIADLRQRAAAVEAARHEVHATVARRHLGPDAWQAWEHSTVVFHAAHAAMYPDEFWRLSQEIDAGSSDAVEAALTFLEADPWCDRSGYAKEWIARPLMRRDLSSDDVVRLGAVLLHLVDVGDRREFLVYCKLARKLGTSSVRSSLRVRLQSENLGVRRRALVMLTSLRRARLDGDDLVAARDILLESARHPGNESVFSGRWLSSLMGRFHDQPWAPELAETIRRK